MLKKEQLILLLLACINFTHITDFMIMMPLGPQLIRIMHISPLQFSYLVSAYTFSAGVSGFAAAFFVDKYDRKKVLLTGYIGFIIGTFACAFSPTYHLLLASRILAGTFGGLIGAQVQSIVADTFPFERRGKAMGTLMAAFSVASVVGVPLGLYFATVYNWQFPFMIVGALGLIIIPLVYFYIPNMVDHIQKHETKPNPFAVITNILSNTNQMRALMLTSTLMFAHFIIVPLLSPFMVANVGFTEHQLTYIYLVGGTLTIFSAPLVGKLADKYGKQSVLTAFSFIALLPLFFITHIGVVPLYVALTITAGFFVFSGGRMIPSMALVSSVVTPQQRGSFMSINSSLQQITTGLAAFIAGNIVIKSAEGPLLHYNWIGYISIAATFACIVIAKKLKPITSSPLPIS
ncbi:MAG: MFS transporter [Bacteroidetes bacterium]|nr:MFS transporter [Bacteroidota bacterium]MBK9801057.1 MFS transporter [Bacteroidota bacterium]MBP6412052.1 MFS transporter [Bacteroidia bacterium]